MVALAAIAVTVSVAGCGGDGKLSNDYVTVNQYKGLEIAKVEKKEVSDDDVEQTIQSRLLSSGKTDGLTKDGAAEDGDWVNIDYSGSVDGTAFDGGTSTGYDLQLGSGTFLAATDDYKGFEEQIVGHKAGEEFDIQVQFPDPYQNNTDLSGKPADFHIVLNKVYAPAELTDEWVASNDDSYTTVDELRKGLKETMQEYYDSQYDSQVKSEIEDKLLETSEVKKYPDGAVDDKVSRDGAAVCNSLSHSDGAAGEIVPLGHTHGAVPNHSACAVNGVSKQLLGLGTDVQAHPAVRNIVGLANQNLGILFILFAAAIVYGDQELHALILGSLHHLAGLVHPVSLQQRGADVVAQVLHKGISHTAADDDGIALVDQIRNHTNLVRHLSAAQNGNQRALGICQCAAHKPDLLLDQITAGSRQVRSHTGGGAVGTVCSAECVVHKQVCQRSQLLGEVLLVLGLLCTVTHILQQHHLAVLQVGSHLLRIVANYILVLSQRHIHAQVLAQALGHGSSQ